MTRLFVALVLLLLAVPAAAQPSLGSGAAEFFAGYSAFLDDSPVEHGVVGGRARIYLSPRTAIGPELVYMRGPGDDRDLFVTGNLTFDLIRPAAGRAVEPFLVVGGGFSRFTNRFGGVPFSSVEGAVTGGGGARIRLTDRVYAIGEFRLGWEPHYRVTGGIGMKW
jgi:hypothetical protein